MIDLYNEFRMVVRWYSGINLCMCTASERWPYNDYSEMTWAVSIAQLTHHEVQGGGKHPETEGRGIFAPTADWMVS